jgi:protein Tex
LNYVSGIGPTLAKNIIEYRTKNGGISTRDELKKVPLLGAKAYEQCAGFLRIQESKNPLDRTAVHPESYSIVSKMAKDNQATIEELLENKEVRQKIDVKKYVTAEKGMFTLQDIVKELDKPGRDPRGNFEIFEYTDGVNKIEDVNTGMVLNGIITNITAFGAFVDIGVKQDGLVHISQMTNKFIKDPNEVVKLSQQVIVKVTEVDIARKRIQLTMKIDG